MNIDLTTNAGKLASRFRRRIGKLDAAIKRGLRNAAIKVDNAQVDLLSGGSEPGDYPIPVRSGNLLQGHFFKVVSDYLALVGNTASYALSVHDGEGSSSEYGPRPFLDDAVERVDVAQDVRKEAIGAVFAL